MNPRDELEITLGQLYYYYSIIREKEYQRQVAMNWVCGVSALFFVIGLLLIRLAYGPSTTMTGAIIPLKLNVYFPPIAFAIWAGLMGGFASLLVRLGKMPTKGDQDTLLTEFDTVSHTLYSGPLLGAFFAVVLYCAFCARMIEGSLFPVMKTAMEQRVEPASPALDASKNVGGSPPVKPTAPATPITGKPPAPSLTSRTGITENGTTTTGGGTAGGTTTGGTSTGGDSTSARKQMDLNADQQRQELSQFLMKMAPASGTNMALLLVWCFIAGYSQTFVPDKLKAITSGATGK